MTSATHTSCPQFRRFRRLSVTKCPTFVFTFNVHAILFITYLANFCADLISCLVLLAIGEPGITDTSLFNFKWLYFLQVSSKLGFSVNSLYEKDSPENLYIKDVYASYVYKIYRAVLQEVRKRRSSRYREQHRTL